VLTVKVLVRRRYLLAKRLSPLTRGEPVGIRTRDPLIKSQRLTLKTIISNNMLRGKYSKILNNESTNAWSNRFAIPAKLVIPSVACINGIVARRFDDRAERGAPRGDDCIGDGSAPLEEVRKWRAYL